MPWFKSDDGFPEHPKSDALAEHFGADWPTLNLAFATWHHMGCDCASRGTDGAFSSARAYRVMRAPREAIDAAVAGLLAVGLLEASEGAFVFHDWHHYQPSNAEVAAKREEVSRKRAEAGRKGGRKSGEARAGSKQNEANGKQKGSKQPKQNEANGQANDEAKLDANALPVGDRSKTEASGRSNDEAPSRPVPSRPVEDNSPPGSAEGATAPVPPPPADTASGERSTIGASKTTEATTKGDDAKPAKRKRAKAAPAPDTIPAPNTIARRVFDAIVGDRGLCAIVVNPGDAAERWADPATYPGVNVLAEVKKAGDWLVTARRPPRDGRAFLRNWLSDAATAIAKAPKVAAPRVPDADGYINRPDPPRPPQYVKILQGDEITRALEEAETTGPFAWALRGRKRATVQGG